MIDGFDRDDPMCVHLWHTLTAVIPAFCELSFLVKCGKGREQGV